MSAIISADGRYRYRLSREWDPSTERLSFIMLNPSTADAELDDPTIRRCIAFAKRDGWGGLNVFNLYAFRATNPRDMKRAIDPVGPENDSHLSLVRGTTIAAWGANADPRRVSHVLDLLSGVPLFHLGLTKDGHPRHPLYLRSDTPLQFYGVAAAA